jgi:hypothetical protein
LDSFAEAAYQHTVLLAVELPADAVRETFFGRFTGTITETGPGSCEVRVSTESPSLLLQYVDGIAALGASYTLSASPETTAVIREVGRQLQLS